MARLDDIFSGVGPNTTEQQGEDFLAAAAVPMRGGHETPPQVEEAMGLFEAAEKPLAKTRLEVAREGIDRTPIAGVSEIRARFSGGATPVFPRTGALLRPRTPAPIEQQLAATPSVEPKPEEAEVALKPEATEAAAPSPAALSDEEFWKLVELQGCLPAARHFETPRKVRVVIRLESAKEGRLTVKEMKLQFNEEQRLLVMVRRDTARFIRLNDVVKLDARSNVLDVFRGFGLPSEVRPEFAAALYFGTTKYPMMIVLPNQQERDMLCGLVVFLRALLHTAVPLEVLV